MNNRLMSQLVFVSLFGITLGCSKMASLGQDSGTSKSGSELTTVGTQPGRIPVVGDYAKIPSNFDVNLHLRPGGDSGCGPGADNAAYPDDVGAFRFICNASHNLFDDPIVYPDKPGGAHLHTFFGNTLANAHSTYESLRTTGDSTCDGGPLNRSAYWIPAMLDANEKVVMPDYVTVYYKRLPKTSPKCQVMGKECVPLPRGLRLVFGYDMALTSTDSKQAHAKWGCDDGSTVNVDLATLNCPTTARIGSGFGTPNCWDGVRLDSPNHRDHLSYSSYGNWGYAKCPATHPYVIPQFTMKAWYTHTGFAETQFWHLSSDRMPGKPVLANGSSFHSDWFGAWDDDIMEEWTTNAIDKLMNCSGGNMGSGRILNRPKNFSWSAVPRIVDQPIMTATDHSGH